MMDVGILGAAGQNSPFKSVQYYEVVIAAGSNSQTQTLATPVNKSRAYAYNNGERIAGSPGYETHKHEEAVELTDGSTVTVTTDTADASNARTVSVCVVELYEWACFDVQHWSITLSSAQTSNSYTHPRQVDPNYSHPVHTGQNCPSTLQNRDRSQARVSMASDGSTVTATRVGVGSPAVSLTVKGFTIQWRPAVVASVQRFSVTFSGATASSTATISSVDVNKTMLFYGGCTQNAFQNQQIHGQLTNGTTVTATVGSSSSDNTRVLNGTAVRFKDEFVKSINSAQGSMTSGNTTADTTISAVVLNKTLVHRCGWSTDTGASNVQCPTVFPTSTTNIRAQKVSSAQNTSAPWRALEVKQ